MPRRPNGYLRRKSRSHSLPASNHGACRRRGRGSYGNAPDSKRKLHTWGETVIGAHYCWEAVAIEVESREREREATRRVDHVVGE